LTSILKKKKTIEIILMFGILLKCTCKYQRSSDTVTYLQQAMLVNRHFLNSIQRLEEPVSKIILKFCGGVPI